MNRDYKGKPGQLKYHTTTHTHIDLNSQDIE
jgi:hypothetical protein